ncbi:nicotinate phosphoribosyltransferase [Selenomonadales bacterium OttesenSCG-928-I06]|nr:nicotinate phosphoribosyltransferase [Selenomonadales bacterium OttesenSCG-928-I06]
MRNFTMLTDLYQFTMMQGFYLLEKDSQETVFDRFYRINPCNGGYSLIAGLEQVINYLENINFSDEDIKYLRSLNLFQEEFLEYLKGFTFTGDLWAMPEGTVAFPGEPLLRIKTKRNEALLIETALSMFLNHESLIATRASRMRWAAGKDFLMEFGLRRAQGADASVYGARAAIIGGFDATSNVLAGQMFDIKVVGTTAHSWVMSFDDELTAFREYARYYPNNIILLADTYDTLNSGVPNAIKLFTELREQNKLGENCKYGIRLDSGDLAYLSKQARKMLDAAGFPQASITASNDLDENLVAELKIQGAKIDSWGIGTKLITSDGCSSFGGVYKMSAEIKDENVIPKIKRSNNVEKITNPGIKNVLRFYDKEYHKIIADIVILEGEENDYNKDIILRDQEHPWQKMTLKENTYIKRNLLEPIFKNGKCVYNKPTLKEIKTYAESELSTLWEEYRRLVNPQTMKVNLSDNLYKLKNDLLFIAENS